MNKIEPGMRVTIDDGWTGKVFRVSGDMVDCTKDGPNPHCTGRLVPLAAVTIDRVGITVNLKSKPTVGQQRCGVVADLDTLVRAAKRARLRDEWNAAPLG